MNNRWNQSYMHYKKDYEALRQEGFTDLEIEQLAHLRRNQTEIEFSLTSAEFNRLAFVRWLVVIGKLSDYYA